MKGQSGLKVGPGRTWPSRMQPITTQSGKQRRTCWYGISAGRGGTGTGALASSNASHRAAALH